MASRSISDLHPEFGAKCIRVLDRCRERGVELLVTCTLRSLDEQTDLYAYGRTKPGRIRTKVKPGFSAHNHGCAMDVVPMIHGKPEWDEDEPAWQVYGEEVRRQGLEWAGDWHSMREFPHCQMPNWREFLKHQAS